MILFGIGLFLVGSVLCGVAWSMPALIAFRAVQGLGAGAVQPIAITIAGDIYTVAERATAQGYIASVWAMSSVVGPTLGGVFAELGLWRWIFFVNVPLCLLAGGLIVRNFHETVERREHHVDYLGAVAADQRHDAGHPRRARGRPGLGVELADEHRRVRRRCRAARSRSRSSSGAPPSRCCRCGCSRRRLLATTTALALGVGVILIGLTSYVPTYLEGALGVSPLVAGLALAALTIGWPLAATPVRPAVLHAVRASARPSSSGWGSPSWAPAALALLAHTPSVAVVAVTCFVTGLGMGLVASPSLIAAQASVGWARARGRHRHEHVRPLDRQRGRCRRARRRRQRGDRGVRARPRPTRSPRPTAGAAVFLAVLVAAVLTVVAGLLMPKVDAAVGQGREEPAAAEPLTHG